MLTATGGSWGAGAEPTIPADAGSASFVDALVGLVLRDLGVRGDRQLRGRSFSSHPLLLSQSTSGAWSAGVEPALPYPNASPNANIEAVACAPGGGCTAVADYSDQANNQLAGAVNGTPTTARRSRPCPSTLRRRCSRSRASRCPRVTSQRSFPEGQTSPERSLQRLRTAGLRRRSPARLAAREIGAVAVSGNGSYSPAQGFTPTAAGDYWWYASYGGDLRTRLRSSACGASMDETVVQTPLIDARCSVDGHAEPDDLALRDHGGAVRRIEVTRAGTWRSPSSGHSPPHPRTARPAGTARRVTANVHGNGSLSPRQRLHARPGGDYWWYASYSGDASDPAAASGCGYRDGRDRRQGQPHAVAGCGRADRDRRAAVVSSVGVGQALRRRRTATGTVTFSVFGPQASPPASCGSAPTTKVGSATVHADGAYAPASSSPRRRSGTYWWYASYGGDASKSAAASACGAQMPRPSSPARRQDQRPPPSRRPHRAHRRGRGPAMF